MKNEDTTDIMDELVEMIQLPNKLRSSMSESTLRWISKMVIEESVENKKMELMKSGTKIAGKNVDILDLIDTFELYGLINDSINKYNYRNAVQGFINDMDGNTNNSTMVHNSNKATYMEQDKINDLHEDLHYLRYGLGYNINDANKENNRDNTNLADNGLKFNNTNGAHIVEEKEGWFYEWADTYDE